MKPSCERCDNSFSQLRHLNRDKRIHTGLKTYSCEQCAKTFSRLDYLNLHKRIHTGLKPYGCEQCDKSFSCSSTLNRHKRIHSGLNTYRCDQSIYFNRSDGLITHKRIRTVINVRSAKGEKKKNKNIKLNWVNITVPKGKSRFTRKFQLLNMKNLLKKRHGKYFCVTNVMKGLNC